ncbi:hypothetical protein H2198_000834 [Neophaeococcomyces mojaviensis]|uniref:Uncharacterized protein n=1 Tax=Neophaeococcomyces mojaviensis TaxID=3383035 RepID=A0ACC3AJ20_9EURO|nr:hypothetical protein H2198_000834 [Knufia sp. JES_112]
MTVSLEQITTCAPLLQDEFREIVYSNDSRAEGLSNEGDISYVYNYGPLVTGQGDLFQNHTYFYNTNSFYGHGYNLEATVDGSNLVPYSDNETLPWLPINALATADGELTILFLTQNNIFYFEPCDDPWFAANLTTEKTKTAYWPSTWVSPMACSQQFQICNPRSRSKQCTGFWAALDVKDKTLDIDLNMAQGHLVDRISLALGSSSLSVLLTTRKQNAIAASGTVQYLAQNYLPPDQWMREISGWVNTGLASIQQAVLEYATGPTHIIPGIRRQLPNNTFDNNMCQNQIVNETGDTKSFSVLGMSVLFVVGFIIILTSYILDTVVGNLQQRFRIGEHARLSWIFDDKIQLHKLLYHELNLGEWSEGEQVFPTTKTKRKFSSLAATKSRTKVWTHSVSIEDTTNDNLLRKVFQGGGSSGEIHMGVLPTDEIQQDTQGETPVISSVKRSQSQRN